MGDFIGQIIRNSECHAKDLSTEMKNSVSDKSGDFICSCYGLIKYCLLSI